MSDVTKKYLDNQSDVEEGEIIDDNTYDNISSDEELTLRQRITELEERNIELERIADLSRTYDYGLDYGSGTSTATSISGAYAGSLLDNQKLLGRHETKYKNLYNQKIAYQSNSKKRLTTTKVNNYHRNSKVRRKNNINSKKIVDYKIYLRNKVSSDTEDDSKSTMEHKQKLVVALHHKIETTPVTTKTTLKNKLINMNKNNNQSDTTNKNESDKDSDLELRLVALKSALVKKYGSKKRTVNKTHIVEERPYSPTDLLDKLTEQSITNNDSDYMDISPVESPRDSSINENVEKDINDNNSDCILQPVDMDLVNSDSNNSIQFSNSINSDWLSASEMPLARNFFMQQQTTSYNHQFNHYQEQYFNYNNVLIRTEEDDDEEALRLLLLSKKDTSMTPLSHLSPRNFQEDNDKYTNFQENIQKHNDDYHEKVVIHKSNKTNAENLKKTVNLDTSASDVTLETDCLRNLLLSMMKKKSDDVTINSNNETNNSISLVKDDEVCDIVNATTTNNCLIESINENSSLLKDDNYNCQSKENSNFAIENNNNNNNNNNTFMIQSDNLTKNSFVNILLNNNSIANNVITDIKNTNNINETNTTSAIINDVQSQTTINAKVVNSKRKIVNQSKLNNSNNKLIKLSNNNNKALPINVNDIQIPIVKPIIFSINDNSSDTDDENQSISDTNNIRIDYNKSPISIQMENSLYSPSSQHINEIVTTTQPAVINLPTICINGNKENYNKTMLIHNKPEFEEKLEEFLQNARNKVEQNLLNTNNSNNKVVTNTIDNKVNQQPVTPLAVRHLPQSSQLEYRRLVNRMSILEKQKQYKLKKYLFGKELNKTIKDNHKKLINVKKLKTAIITSTAAAASAATTVVVTKDSKELLLLSTNVPANSILNEDTNLCDNSISCCNNNINELKDKINTNQLNDKNNCDNNLLISQSDCVKDSETLLTDIDKLIKLLHKTNDENNKIILLEKTIEKLYNEIKIKKNDLNIHKNNINIIYPKILLKNENLINMENILKNRNTNIKSDNNNNNSNNSNYRLPKSMKIEIVNKIKLLLKENSKLDSESLKTILNKNYNECNYEALLRQYENIEEIDEQNHKQDNVVVAATVNHYNLENSKEIVIEEIMNHKKDEEITKISNKVARSYQSPLDSLNSEKVIRNPDGVICPFQLMGQCEDKECKYEHL